MADNYGIKGTGLDWFNLISQVGSNMYLQMAQTVVICWGIALGIIVAKRSVISPRNSNVSRYRMIVKLTNQQGLMLRMIE